jgi:hypothetical protein
MNIIITVKGYFTVRPLPIQVIQLKNLKSPLQSTHEPPQVIPRKIVRRPSLIAQNMGKSPRDDIDPAFQAIDFFQNPPVDAALVGIEPRQGRVRDVLQYYSRHRATL